MKKVTIKVHDFIHERLKDWAKSKRLALPYAIEKLLDNEEKTSKSNRQNK